MKGEKSKNKQSLTQKASDESKENTPAHNISCFFSFPAGSKILGILDMKSI